VFILLNGWICLHGVSALSRFSNALKIAFSFIHLFIHSIISHNYFCMDVCYNGRKAFKSGIVTRVDEWKHQSDTQTFLLGLNVVQNDFQLTKKTVNRAAWNLRRSCTRLCHFNAHSNNRCYRGRRQCVASWALVSLIDDYVRSHSSGGASLSSFRIWLIHLQRGRRGTLPHSLLGGRPIAYSSCHRKKTVGCSWILQAMWPKMELFR